MMKRLRFVFIAILIFICPLLFATKYEMDNVTQMLIGYVDVDTQLYEAATLDGSNKWQQFKYVTLPQLRPTTFFVIVMLTIQSFKVYDQIYMITQGGPGSSTLVLVYHIYNTAFIDWELGYASAVAMIMFLLVLVVTLIQFHGEKKYAND